MKIVNYSDPGHGWYKVKRSILKKLNILDKVTSYSYQLGEYVYLEEDCDMSLFLNAYFNNAVPDQWWNVLKVEKKCSNKESKIRNHPRFNPIDSPKIFVGLKFKLYGQEYTAHHFNGKAWIVSTASNVHFKLKNSQLSEITI